MIVFLFVLMILDYILTKYGMTVGFIREGNGLMCWLMALPAEYGLLIKAVISVILLIPIYIAGKYNKKLQKVALYIVFGAYAIVFAMHAYWIYWYVVTV